MDSAIHVGIDLGTAAIRLAVRDASGVHLLDATGGGCEVPAVVSFSGTRVHLGARAQGMAVMQPAVTLAGVARLLGVQDSVMLDQARSPQSLAALLIDHVLQQAQDVLGERPRSAVFVEPTPVSYERQAALRDAAALAQLDTVGFVPEPVAAATALCEDAPQRLVAIVDVGAAHVSAAVLRTLPGSEPAIVTVERKEIGGDDVDAALVEHFTGVALRHLDPAQGAMLRQFCASMKQELASTDLGTCPVPPFLQGNLGLPDSLQLDIATLKTVMQPLSAAVEACCEKVRATVGRGPSELSEVYLTGGMTRLPAVREPIERAFGTRARIAHSVSPGALGAALLGEVELQTSPDRARADMSWKPKAYTRSSSPPARTSLPPGAVRQSDAPSRPVSGQRPAAHLDTAIEGGHIDNPLDPAGVLELALARRIRATDLDPMSLPLLLLLTGNKRRSGGLTLEMQDAAPMTIGLFTGKALLNPTQAKALASQFCRGRGSYLLSENAPARTAGQTERRMLPLVVDGLRTLVRGFKPAALLDALGDRADRAPHVGPTHMQTIERMGLTAAEMRAIKFSFNGRTRAGAMLGGPNELSVMTLLLLTTLFDVVEWQHVTAETDTSLRVELEKRATQMARANLFAVLGVHWSASRDEIKAAYHKLVKELTSTQPADRAAPEAVGRMRTRVEEAYITLRGDQSRSDYRRKTFPDLDFDSLEELLDRKADAMSLRADGQKEARTLRERRRDITRSKKGA